MNARFLLAAIVAACVPLATAHACSCAWGRTQDALESADAVFLGRPVAFRPSLLDPLSGEVTRFRVERQWKGDVAAEVSVVTWYDTSCGWSFSDDGAPVVVFAWRVEWGRLATGACSGTASVGEDQWLRYYYEGKRDSFPDPGLRTLAELGPGFAPVGPPADDPWTGLLTWALVTTAVMASWALARWRQRRADEG